MDALNSIIDMLEREPTFEERLAHLEDLARDGLHPRDCGEYRDARHDVVRAYKDTDIGKKDAQLASLRAQLAAAEERIEQLQRAFPPCHVCKAKVGEIHSEICSVEPGEHTVEHAQFFMESQISSSRAQLAKKDAECERLRNERDESQIVAAYIANNYARDNGLDPFDVLDEAKNSCREAADLASDAAPKGGETP